MAVAYERSVNPDLVFWRRCVKHWFPHLGARAYFVPPAYLCKTQHETVQFAGQDVRVTQPPLVDLSRGAKPVLVKSQVREDEAHQRILHCLHKVFERHGEPVFVISQLQFGDYLGEACYAAATRVLPRPIDMKKEKKDRGDFDLLLLHKHYGIVVAEVKSVGGQFGLTCTQQQQTKVAERISKAIRQLNKAGDVLRHLVSDLVSDQQSPVRVRKTIMLPNITRDQLQTVLDNNPQVKQELCQCLELESPADLADLCLTADKVWNRESPSDVSKDVLKRLAGWWIRAVAAPNVSLPDDTYEDLVARFAGPATTFRVFSVTQPPLLFRSLGEGVLETSRRFTKDIVLHPYQLEVLNRNEPLVWVCGPPGTGKTVMLVVRGRDWLCRGWNVHVVSTRRESLAASYLIVHQLQQIEEHLQQTKGKAEQLENEQQTVQQLQCLQMSEDQPHQLRSGHTEERVRLHVFDFNDKGQVRAAVTSLQEASVGRSGPLCVLADETCRDTTDESPFTQFCTALSACFPDRLCLWAASMYHKDCPPGLTEAAMTEALRTPPVATEQVRQTSTIKKFGLVRDYTEGPSPAPSYGPHIRYVYHRGHGHSEGSPVNCEMCGAEVAEELSELHVAVTGEPTTTTTIPAPLTYRDVFLLTEWDAASLDREARDSAGNITRQTSGILLGLRNAGVPVKVVKPGDAAAVKDVALMGGADEVVAAWVGTVSGLERPVVVWVQTYMSRQAGSRLTRTQEGVYRQNQVRDGVGRLWAVSRTTAQLIWVVWPFDSLDTESDEEKDQSLSVGYLSSTRPKMKAFPR